RYFPPSCQYKAEVSAAAQSRSHQYFQSGTSALPAFFQPAGAARCWKLPRKPGHCPENDARYPEGPPLQEARPSLHVPTHPHPNVPAARGCRELPPRPVSTFCLSPDGVHHIPFQLSFKHLPSLGTAACAPGACLQCLQCPHKADQTISENHFQTGSRNTGCSLVSFILWSTEASY